MITTLIFDFGDVFINLDKKGALENALNLFNLNSLDEDIISINKQYEVGAISTNTFINFYLERFPNLNEKKIIDAWNYIIKDFPEYRLDFIKKLKSENKFKCILLSNTNEMHIDYIKHNVSFYEDFKNCFDSFYLSHEINLRKPNTNCFEFVLDKNNLTAEECLFIDDTEENTDAAKKLGIYTWNIDETKEDVINLFETQKSVF